MSKRTKRDSKNIKDALIIPKVNRIYKAKHISGKSLKFIMAACHFSIFLSFYICVVSMMRHSWGAGQGSVKNLKPHPYHILETTLEVPDRHINGQGVDFCSVFREYSSDFLSTEDFCPRE